MMNWFNSLLIKIETIKESSVSIIRSSPKTTRGEFPGMTSLRQIWNTKADSNTLSQWHGTKPQRDSENSVRDSSKSRLKSKSHTFKSLTTWNLNLTIEIKWLMVRANSDAQTLIVIWRSSILPFART
jgi:hypothetical protein